MIEDPQSKENELTGVMKWIDEIDSMVSSRVKNC